jgi:hypothetical protein
VGCRAGSTRYAKGRDHVHHRVARVGADPCGPPAGDCLKRNSGRNKC